MIALRGLRQPAVGRRFDFKTPIARYMTGTRIIMSDARLEIDEAAAKDRGLHMLSLVETPIAFDDGIGCIDAVDNDGHAGAAWNHDDGTIAAGEGRQRRSGQNDDCKSGTHGLKIPFLAAI